MNTRQFELKSKLDRLAIEYKETWKRADHEKRTTGNISRQTTRKLVNIEKAIEAIDNAW